MEIPVDAIDRLWAFCPCNVTGKQSLALETEFLKRGVRVDVYSADIQETSMATQKPRHHVGDYKEAYEILLKAYGKPPVVVLGNPSCQFTTFAAKENHFQLGDQTAEDKERVKEQKKWLEIKFWMLHTPGCPVIITENPKGYAMTVITLADGGRAYVKVQPWHFLGFDGNFDIKDNHVKETYLFSAGNKDAIDKYPIEAHIVWHEMPDGCVKDWVRKQKDSNARSVVPTGMAYAISKCAVDRYFHHLKRTTPKEFMQLAFHEDKINSSEAAQKQQCNRFIGMYNGETCYCNLPPFHDTERNLKRGVTCCAFVDWSTPCGTKPYTVLLTDTPPTAKRPSEYCVYVEKSEETFRAEPPVKPPQTRGPRLQYGGNEGEDTDDEDDDGAPSKPVLAVLVEEKSSESATRCTSDPVLATVVKTHSRTVDGVLLPSPKPTAVAKSKTRASRSSKIMRRFKRASAIKKMKLASTSYATLGKYIMEADRAEKRIADLLKQF